MYIYISLTFRVARKTMKMTRINIAFVLVVPPRFHSAEWRKSRKCNNMYRYISWNLAPCYLTKGTMLLEKLIIRRWMSRSEKPIKMSRGGSQKAKSSSEGGLADLELLSENVDVLLLDSNA